MAKKQIDKWQYGDFQTPLSLARKVVDILKSNHNLNPETIIEPTCGEGAFVRASCEGFTLSKVQGFEINPAYVSKANAALNELSLCSKAEVIEADFFSTDWDKLVSKIDGYLLFIGNPPWVTSSELGMLNSINLPEKSNFQNHKGIDAITGSGNFDISEWMLLRHIELLSNHNQGSIAFLCKYSVARKVMRQICKDNKSSFSGYIYAIDAKLHFNAAVEACLFVLIKEKSNTDCEIYDSLDSLIPSYVIGERDGYIVKNVSLYEKWREFNKTDSAYVWRSGIKHDCSKIMELQPSEDGYENGFGEILTCEDDYIYPLFKSSDIGNGRIKSYRKLVIVTQKNVGEDTKIIQRKAPKTWNYLVKNQLALNNRKSSIYKNKPPFSIFGVGDYSFKPWKIAISGLYKKLNFVIIGPLDGKTVFFDDTVNFLSFDTEEEANFIFTLITSEPAIEFLESMIFWDEKRPITIQLLKRLSLKEVAHSLGLNSQYQVWEKTRLSNTSEQLSLISE